MDRTERFYRIDQLLNQRRVVPLALFLDEQLASGYGIFSGARTRTARLRFGPERARWVADEVWHPQQTGAYDEEGFWLLAFPYSDDRELLLDVLKHGEHVEVLAPRDLRAKVRRAHRDAAARYQRG